MAAALSSPRHGPHGPPVGGPWRPSLAIAAAALPSAILAVRIATRPDHVLTAGCAGCGQGARPGRAGRPERVERGSGAGGFRGLAGAGLALRPQGRTAGRGGTSGDALSVHNDAAPTGIAALFLLRAGTLPVSDGLRGLLWLPAWIGPGLLIWTVALMPGPQPPAAWLLLPGMALTLAVVLWPRAACPHPPDFARPSAGCQR